MPAASAAAKAVAGASHVLQHVHVIEGQREILDGDGDSWLGAIYR
jgi:hypothetical protein